MYNLDNTDSSIKNKGFTVVELMITLAISMVIAGAIMLSYQAQRKSMTNQLSVSSMQQDLRAAAIVMEREIREAGADPFVTAPTGAGVTVATQNSLGFTKDIAGDFVEPNKYDGELDDPNEDITYTFPEDTDGNGIAGGVGGDWTVTGNLARDTGGGAQTLITNVDALEFNYILNDGSQTLNPPNLNLIRGVQVSILVRASREDPKFANTLTYQTGSGTVWTPRRPDGSPDGFRRRLVIFTVFCRNLGL